MSQLKCLGTLHKSKCPKMNGSRKDKSTTFSVCYCLDKQMDSKYKPNGTINGANDSTIVRDTGALV